jgi:hypothetical protein
MVRRARTSSLATPASGSKLSERDIIEAYLYLLGRLLVLRQEHLDFRDDGFEWNELVHRDPGGVSWANPNLDVAYSEAWIAVDEHSSTLIDVPEITGRYFTVQILNLWGETLVNINERNFPRGGTGTFLIALKGTHVTLPTGATRVDLPGPKARVLIRVALGADRKEAVTLQRQITMRATGSPVIDPPVSIPLFTNEHLPGVEAFEMAPAILASEPDINPGTSVIQSKVRAVSGAAGDPAERKRIDDVIRKQAWARLKQQIAVAGATGNGWVKPRVAGNYGDDWLMRTVVNFTGIWANNQQEVIYFGNGRIAPLNGSDTYTATFAKDDLPDSRVQYFWSVTCVDAVNYRVIPNAEHRFVLNQQSPLEFGRDGALTLYFAPAKPAGAPDGNWLPTPAGQHYVLTWRSYGPDQPTIAGQWFPAALVKQSS